MSWSFRHRLRQLSETKEVVVHVCESFIQFSSNFALL